MKNKPLFLVVATLLAFFALAPLTGCVPKDKDTDAKALCDNGIKDAGETDIDCGGVCERCLNACDTFVCQNGGLCTDSNECFCLGAYTGNRCQTIARTLYLGNYKVSGVSLFESSLQADTFTNLPVSLVAKGSGIDGMDVSVTFSNRVVKLYSTIYAGTAFQIIDDYPGNGYHYIGGGSFEINGADTTLHINFTERDSASYQITYIYLLNGNKN